MIKFNISDDERMGQNILNELNADESVYRFISVDRLFELVNDKELVLIRPSKWDDPFEDFLSNTVVINDKNEHIGFVVTKDYYGQC